MAPKDADYGWECKTLLRESFRDSVESNGLADIIKQDQSRDSIDNIRQKIDHIKSVAHG